MKRHLLWAGLVSALLVVAFSSSKHKSVEPLREAVTQVVRRDEPKQQVQEKKSAPLLVPLTSDPLQRSTELGSHVLLSKTLRQEKEKLLSSEALLAQVFTTLNQAEGPFSEEQIKVRIQAIDHLGAAAFWKENPLRQRVIEKTVQLLEKDIASVEGTSEMRQAVAGDLIELYTVLLQSDSERARDLYFRSSEKQQKLFRFAKNLVETSQKGSLNHGE